LTGQWIHKLWYRHQIKYYPTVKTSCVSMDESEKLNV
jgi:hypothetical protein